MEQAAAQGDRADSATFNWDHLYLGGGNTKLVTLQFRPNVTIVSNLDGLLGGVALWRDEE